MNIVSMSITILKEDFVINYMKKRGFTLIELLAVIIILGVLAALIIPKVVNSFIEKGKFLHSFSVKYLMDIKQWFFGIGKLNILNCSKVVDFCPHIRHLVEEINCPLNKSYIILLFFFFVYSHNIICTY